MALARVQPAAERRIPEWPSERGGGRGAAERTAESLSAELSRRIEGEVRFDEGSRALYAADLSVYRQVPIGVVIPRAIEDVIETVAVCREHGVPILGRGCGTSLAGQCCNVAVVIDFAKYLNRILELDPAGRAAWVEPGVICDQLRGAAERHHLTFAPDPATHEYCTLGGMIGNNSCGAHSVMGGKTSENIEELDILTYDGLRLRVGRTDDAAIERMIRAGGRTGEIVGRLKGIRDRYADEIRRRFPQIPRRVSGYNLDELLPENGFHLARSLVGSESTCVLVLGAKVRLVPSPPGRALLVIGYPDLPAGADEVPRIMEYGPIALEAFDGHIIDNMKRKGKRLAGAELLPAGSAWLVVEFGGESRAEAAGRAHEVMESLGRSSNGRVGMKVIDDRAGQKGVWEIREAGVGASRVPGIEDAWPSWEDSAVAPDRLGPYLRDLRALLERYGYRYSMYGHFGQGCVHMRSTFDLKTVEGVASFRSFMEEGADLVVSYGGSLSGEHGDGQARGELLPRMFGREIMQAFREFKAAWDPDGRMNPGKVIDANPLDQDLRTGPDYRPLPVMTHFKFPDDHGSFAEATERCFGVGKCRRLDGGIMCPSFMVTREEMHSTRGRAHLLFEMLRGDALTDVWRSEPVKEALDLCLACKGCKGDCPVSVDVATYKAEFLSHYYEGRLRPRSAYAFGLVSQWARPGSAAPGLANFFTQTPLVRDVVKWVAGMEPRRRIPAFAPRTFREWFQRRGARNRGMPRVLLWPDTFNNHFYPETAQAAVEVLEAAGYERQLRQILETLRPELEAGTPVIGLEPSCVAVFRDELHGLMPDDDLARRLGSQTFMLSEFLEQRPPADPPAPVNRKALVQGHCHHKSVLEFDAEEAVLSRHGLDFTVVDSGCCGMAGSFGFEKGERYDVSIKAGERVLLPAVREASADTLIMADGFSCREQIAQGTDRQALHLAEVLHAAQRLGADGLPRNRPEQAVERPRATLASKPLTTVVAGLLVAGGAAWLLRSHRRGKRSTAR